MHLGIDIGGTNIKSGVIDGNNNLIDKYSIPANAHLGRDAIMSSIYSAIDRSLERFPIIRSIGIGLPGIIDDDGNLIVSPNLTALIGLNFKKHLSEKFHFPVSVDNDANTAAYAELYLGSGKDLDSFLYITLGTGVGGAIISERRLFRGFNSSAGEAGHIIIDDSNKQFSEGAVHEEFQRGTLESLIGRAAIISRANSLLSLFPDSKLNNLDQLDVSDISDAAANGDLASIRCLEETGYYLGLGLSSIINLLGFYHIIIGGGISSANNILYESALSTIKRRALPLIAQNARIIKAHFKSDAGIIGAALIGKNNNDVSNL
jgi:glucokinase